MTIALTRSPGPELAQCELTFVERAPIDHERALAQHADYRAALQALGAEVVNLPALDGAPDATFVEDPALVLEDIALLTRPGAESRHVESASLAEALSTWRPLEHMEAPGTLDGGDILRIGEVLYVGQTSRSDHAGLKQLAHRVLPHGLRVKAIQVEGSLHLKTACTWLGGNTLLVHRDWIDTQRLDGFEFLDIDPDEPFAANALRVGGGVLLAASAARTAQRVEALGIPVRLVELSEFEKAEGGPTCLSLLIEPRP